MTCPAAEALARLARAHGWTVEVRYRRGHLDYTHKGNAKPGGGHYNVQVAEPVSSAGVYCTRGNRRVNVWYVARELPERRTPKGALSWALLCATGRKEIGDGHCPTAFVQAVEKGKPVGPTTKAQVEAYLVEHGAQLVEGAA